MQPIFVRWKDATSSDDWVEADDIALEPNEICSAGFLLDDGPTHLTMCLSIDTDRPAFSQRLAIPKGWIKEMMLYPEVV